MKFVQWLSKIVVGTVLITSITIFTTWYVVNMYVEDIFRQLNIPPLGKKVQFSEFAARLAGELNIVKPRDGGKQAGTTQTDAASQSPQPGANPSPSSNHSTGNQNSMIGSQSGAGTTGSDTAAGADGDAKDDAVAVMGRAHSDAETQKKDLVLSTEDFAKKKEALSSDDKMKIFSLVVAKLPQDEVQQLSAILENGVTTDEVKEVDQTLKKYLNEQEYKQLTDIISKY
ncbi:hypothetical protein [Paenibacillus sedimenti]|uniref:Spore coat protein n=1 Tax=Paenibacillus sedimenti TaxID=2770274 RepID=A0A926KQS4_9BACL|nr:hypothetical protein [Paenibacillus sedimenti]MBD0382230.1 hypothetical protein [Paenibacillus sedimenti]